MATYKVFFTNAGVPATGLSPTIPVLKRVDTQDDITPPLVYEIGGGWYTFEHEPAQAQVGYVDGTATLADADRYIPIDLNLEDVYLDAPVAVLDTVADAIKAKTDNLPSDPADESLIIAATDALASAISTVSGKVDTVDGIVDTIAVDVAGLDGAAMRGTDSAATATALAALDGKVDIIDGIVDTIAVDVAGLDGAAMRGTDSAALASVCTEGRLAELDAANLPADVDAILIDTSTTLDTKLNNLALVSAEILIDTGTTLNSFVASIDSDTTDLLAAVAVVDGNVDTILADVAVLAPIDPAAIADAVWDEVLTGHNTVDDSAGKLVFDAEDNTGMILLDTGTTLDTALAAIQADTLAILEDTGTTLPAAIAVVDGIVDDILVDTGTTLDGKIDTIDTVVDEIVLNQVPPTAEAIADAVLDELVADHVVVGSLSAVIATLDAAVISSPAGIGAVENTVTVTVDDVAEAGVDVWVTSDEAGTSVVAGTLQTDVAGQVVFWLDVGTYYVWQQKSGFNFTNPDTLVVT